MCALAHILAARAAIEVRAVGYPVVAEDRAAAVEFPVLQEEHIEAAIAQPEEHAVTTHGTVELEEADVVRRTADIARAAAVVVRDLVKVFRAPDGTEVRAYYGMQYSPADRSTPFTFLGGTDAPTLALLNAGMVPDEGTLRHIDLDLRLDIRDLLPRIKETSKVVNDRTTNWTIVPFPNPGWAGVVHPDLDGDAALERLTEEIVHVLRLDESDPVAAWQERFERTTRAAAALTDRRFDAVRFEGPGTDLTIGLLPSSRWGAARFETIDGLVHHPNLPTEEAFTTPEIARLWRNLHPPAGFPAFAAGFPEDHRLERYF